MTPQSFLDWLKDKPSRLVIAALIAFALILLFAAGTARADMVCGQQRCAPYAEVRADLKTRFGEVLQWRELSSNGMVVEFWKSDRGGWTVIKVHPNGRACGIAAGHHSTPEAGT